MTRSTDIPYCFAILRTDRVDGPCIQFLRAEIHHQYDGDSAFTVQTAAWDDDMRGASYETMEHNEFDGGIYTFRFLTSSSRRQGVQEYKFWFLPFYYQRNGLNIPVIDFQFKSWLPSVFTSVPIRENEREFLQIYDDIHASRIRELFDGAQLERRSRFEFEEQFDRFHWSFAREPRQLPFLRRNLRAGRRDSGMVDIPIRTPSPPSRRTRRRDTIFDVPIYNPGLMYDDVPPTPRHIIAAGGGQPVPIQAPAPAPQIVRIPIAIPKHIGAILLANARTGSDTCPIAATPFAECGKLALTPCFHIFDADNLQRWQSTNNTCPVCRTELATVVMEELANSTA
jgi:hypothetical protein